MITDAFARAGEQVTRAKGLQEHPLVVVGHPIGNKTAEDMRKIARDSADRVAQGLVASSPEAKVG